MYRKGSESYVTERERKKKQEKARKHDRHQGEDLEVTFILEGDFSINSESNNKSIHSIFPLLSDRHENGGYVTLTERLALSG